MRKRTSIFGAILISTAVIVIFFIASIAVLRINQYFNTKESESISFSNISFLDFFLNISTVELLAILGASILMTLIVFFYIASNIKVSFEKFNQFFYKAAYEGKMIDEKDLNYKEFTTLANSVNHMVQKANEDKKWLEFNKKYLQAVLDAQKNIVVVQSKGELETANQAFYNFMHVRDLEEFKSLNNCISDFFIEDTGYLTKEMEGDTWVRYIVKHQLKNHKVKISNNNKDIIFAVNAKMVEIDDNYKVVITFNNISEIEEQKRALEKTSTIDALTRVANRMKFDTILEQQVEMSLRYNHSFCLILFDIDNFKKVNDTYGHQVGDNILVELAMLVKNAMRKSDTFARWGGEEFAIILPQSRIKTAVKIAEKLRLKIVHNDFEDNLNITCSFGVCEYKKIYNLESLIEAVDEKLYLAKSSGKNQVQY